MSGPDLDPWLTEQKAERALASDELHDLLASANNALMPDPITRTELDSKFEAIRADMRAGFSELRVENARSRDDTSRWMLNSILTIVSVLVVGIGGLGLGLYNALKPGIAAPSQQPIVIYSQPAQAAPPTAAASR